MWQKTIILSKVFDFKDRNLKEMIEILVNLSKLWHKEIQIDFSNIKQIRKGDLMALMAQLEKLSLRQKQIKFTGNISKNVRDLLSEKVVHFRTDVLNNAKIASEVNPDIVENVVNDLKVLGISRNSIFGYTFYERIKALLTEIMGNAVEHGIRNKNINYWLTSEIDTKNKQIIFTFVDMGQGIAHSHKRAKTFLKITGLFSDNKIIIDSLEGKLPSSTQELNRGKGLPEIRKIIEKKIVSEFVLVTNRTLVQYNNNQFSTTRISNFKGTYYCWTINKNNFEKWKRTFQ
jgi:hypothetical protein